MYHWFVARKARDTFARISSGDWEPMIAGMATQFSYRFYGQSARTLDRLAEVGITEAHADPITDTGARPNRSARYRRPGTVTGWR
jgi:hypothetical protein